MPPRTVKRGAAQRRGGRATRGSQKAAASHPPPPEDSPEDPVIAEELPIPAKEEDPIVEPELVVEEKPPVIEEKPVLIVEIISESISQPNGVKKEEKPKEPMEDYGKDERLELEDNDPEEYETDGVDFDEKEIDPEEDVPEVGDDEEEEDTEENLDEDDEGDDEEELEDGHEELEGEDFEAHRGVDQVNAERAYADEAEHHEVVKERRKRKEFEIFVGGLDKEVTEGDLRKCFSSIGEVTEVRLMMNLQTKKNKGFAFLRFATVEQAKRAVTEMKHPVINGKQCGVTPSQDSDTLFLGNICKSWTKEALKEKLKHYGVDNVEDLTLVDDSNNQGLNRGFAFLEFSSRSEAKDAFRRLQKRDISFGIDRPAKVSFADSFIDPGDEIMAQVKTVFVDGLLATWEEDRVRGFLKKYGEIAKIELARNMPSARRKDFGFVTFGTHEAAVICAKSINNAELGEGETKTKVRARLSRPLQKGKGKHVGRGDFRSSRTSGRSARGTWSSSSRKVPVRPARGTGSRTSPPRKKRPVASRDRQPVSSSHARTRPLPPPPRSYDRRAPVPSYPKSSLKREYSRREEIPPPRSRAAAPEYGSRIVLERRHSYRDEYTSRGPGYSDPPRDSSRPSSRRGYVDDGYSQRFERPPPPPPPPPPSYRNARGREYESVSGSKRPYSSMDDVPLRYPDSSVRQSRARLDYEYVGSASQYGDAYGDRLGRSSLGYSSSRTSQDSHGMYGGRHGMGYGGSSYGGNDVGGMYSSSYGAEYVPRGSDVGGSSYSSLYPGRGGGGSSYMGGGGSGSYY